MNEPNIQMPVLVTEESEPTSPFEPDPTLEPAEVHAVESILERPRLAAWAHRIQVLARLVRLKWHDEALLARVTSHFAMLLVASLVVILSQWSLSLPAFALPNIFAEPEQQRRVVFPRTGDDEVAEPVAFSFSWGTLAASDTPAERPAMERTELVVYIVRAGDTPIMIAKRFGLKPETIVWANPELEETPSLLRIGQRLIIPPVDGVLHTVKEGDTLAGIASKYQASVEDIINWAPNNLAADSTLVVGQKIMVPGGVKPMPVRYAPAPRTGQWISPPAFNGASGRFIWPVAGVLTQAPWSGHMALDIANVLGTPIYAADAGVVIFAGWDTTGYGNSIVIDHGNGFRTRYAHMSTLNVTLGQQVSQGQLIARVGSTGRSTGPHLHFEILYNGVRQNPYNYLP